MLRRHRSTGWQGQNVENSGVSGDVLINVAKSAVDGVDGGDLVGVPGIVALLNVVELGTDGVVVFFGEGMECTNLVKVVSHGV